MEIYIGKIIKKLRIKKKLTQNELAQNICSQKQLLRIEQNQSTPNSFLLYELSNRLGKDLLEYLPYCDDENAYELKTLIDKLENLYDRHMYQEVKELLENSDHLKTTHNTRAIQMTEWLKGAIANYIDVAYVVDVNYFLNIYRFNQEIKSVDDIFNSYFNDVDCKIMNSIIVLYLKQEKYKLSETLLLKTIKKTEYESINGFHAYYVKNLYNLSRLYLNQERFEEAIIFSKKGIDHCVYYNVLSYLADLYNILGRSEYHVGDEASAKENLRNYVNIRKLIKNDLKSNEVVDLLIEEYKL